MLNRPLFCGSNRAQCSAAEKLSDRIESKEATIFPERYPDVAEFLQHISGSSLTRALHEWIYSVWSSGCRYHSRFCSEAVSSCQHQALIQWTMRAGPRSQLIGPFHPRTWLLNSGTLQTIRRETQNFFTALAEHVYGCACTPHRTTVLAKVLQVLFLLYPKQFALAQHASAPDAWPQFAARIILEPQPDLILHGVSQRCLAVQERHEYICLSTTCRGGVAKELNACKQSRHFRHLPTQFVDVQAWWPFTGFRW